jgi:3-dehydroquinate synthase
VTRPPEPCDENRTLVTVDLGPRSYEIDIASGSLASCAARIAGWRPTESPGRGRASALVVSDRNVRPHAAAVAASLADSGWRTAQVELEPGETAKSLETAARLYDALVDLKADRTTVVVAVGGGVVGDTAGFAAATYARGLPFVQVPTSLLAQVDSSVGGKVGVNHPRGKNLIGAFHQPIGVLIDTATLATLPEAEYVCGLAEVIKYGVILDGAFFGELEANVEELRRRDPRALRRVIARSCRLKADVVEQDERETSGVRAVLNYGHTFGHAYESLAGYGSLRHGEAVAIGMVHASRLAERLGRVDAAATARQVALLAAVGLPTRLPAGCVFSVEDVLDRMRLDKKTSGGSLRFVLPTRIGHVELVEGIAQRDVRGVLTEALEPAS